jgi:GSH-dependent disulfide-bond oxidoreductase
MIDLWYAPTPNGWKISIMLEECGLAYRARMMDLTAGDQVGAQYRQVGPAGKIPGLVDNDPVGGGSPISLFESGAILWYLAEKTGRFLPADLRGRTAVHSWLMWQMSALGPMLGQHGHFLLYAPSHEAYALDRFRTEAARLYGILDQRLATSAYVGGDGYTIADMACFPWIMTHKAQRFSLDDYPAIRRWYADVRARDAVQRGLALGREEGMMVARAGVARDEDSR